MTKHIKILSSGREFVSEGNSTLLEAGLYAGLAFDYGCSNGNCGKCIAKLVSGEVEKVRLHDFSINDAAHADGHILMCCNRALTDVTLEAPQALSTDEIPQQQITARVKSIEIVNDNVALLHLKTPRTNRLRFLAGQYVQLGGNNMPTAIQPISSCPCDDMNLHFHIRAVPGDEFSDYIFNQLRKGSMIDLNGPVGDFVLDENSPRAAVFIAWHTGFGPIRSLIEHAMALEAAGSMHLVWITEKQEDRYQNNLCRSWQDAFDNFFYIPVEIDKGDAGFKDFSIREHLDIKADDLPNYDFYVAGHEALLSACEQILPQSQLKTTTIP
jgi:CDP-4-dehydro-6-deoxyglucose reductase